MNVKHTKKPETRVDVKYLSSLGIKPTATITYTRKRCAILSIRRPQVAPVSSGVRHISRETASHRKRWPKPCATREGIR